MDLPNNIDYKQLLSDVIRKEIVILGPDITFAKARNVPGLVVDTNGNVIEIQGDAKEVAKALIDQFMELSGLIVKKTMEPLVNSFAQSTPPVAASPEPRPVQPLPEPLPQPTIPPTEPLPKQQ